MLRTNGRPFGAPGVAYESEYITNGVSPSDLPRPSFQSGTHVYEVDPVSGQVNKLRVGRILGRGGFAKCYEVFDGKVAYALKAVNRASLDKPKTLQKLHSEIAIHRRMKHKHIVNFVRTFKDRYYVYMLLEKCDNGTLMDLIKIRPLTVAETQYVMLQCLSAMQYMHTNHVIHRDLKPGNIMLDADLNVKIGDFGLAAELQYDGERKRTICGTPNYIAPEIIDRKSRGHSFEVDTWSLGVILYTLLVGQPPFQMDDVESTYNRIRECRYDFPANVPEVARDLIRQILQSTPQYRPTLLDIRTHAFFSSPPMYPPSSFATFGLPMDRAPAQSAPPPSQPVQRRVCGQEEAPPYNAVAGGKQSGAHREIFQAIDTNAANNNNNNAAAPATTTRATAASSRHRIPTIPAAGANPTSQPTRPVMAPPGPLTAESKEVRRRSSATTRAAATTPTPPPTSTQTERMPPPPPAAVNYNSGSGDNEEKPPSRHSSSSPKEEQGRRSSPAAAASPPVTSAAAAKAGNEEEEDEVEDRHQLTALHDKLHQTLCEAEGAVAAGHRYRPGQATAASAETAEEALPAPQVWVTDCADFSAKYGMSYRLSTGQTGAHFNDSTKMVWEPITGRVEYYARVKVEMPQANGETALFAKDQLQAFNMSVYPESLEKKITLIKYFKSYLSRHRTARDKIEVVPCSQYVPPTPPRLSDPHASEDFVYVKRWLRTSEAMVFRLSNKTVQVCFNDKADVILNSEWKVVTYTDPTGYRRTMQLSTAAVESEEAASRLRYTKSILYQLIKEHCL